MTLVDELVNKARNDYILAGTREERNRLGSAITADADTVTFGFDVGGIVRGARISVGLEDMYVWGSDGTSATVDRGQWGTTAVDHPEGSVALVNARPSPAQVVRAMNTTINQLGNMSVFAVGHTDIATDGSTIAYDLDAPGFMSILDVRLEVPAAADDWPLISNWQLAGGLDASQFPSGRGIRFYDGLPAGRTVRVRYKRALVAGLAALDDVVEDVTGLESWAVDVLALGAAVHLTAGREIARNRDDRQGDTRRAAEVPPNSQLLSMRGVLALYDDQVAGIKRHLNVLYPVRTRVPGS